MISSLVTLICALFSAYVLFRALKPVRKPKSFEWSPAFLPNNLETLQTPSLHAHSPDKITAYNPRTFQVLSTYPSLTPNDITQMIDKADLASHEWSKSSFSTRKAVLESLLRWCLDNMEEITKVCCLDTGKTEIDAAFGELLTTLEKLRWCIANGESILSPSSRNVNLLLLHKKAYVEWEPLGVIGAIVSWNYPFHNLLSPVIAAITTGNTIIVKPSEYVSYSSALFRDAIHSCLKAHGLSPDIVQIAVGCEAEAGATLCSDERLGHLLFIGSEPVGRKVAELGGKAGTQVCLELGGKDPCVILEDADLGFFTPTFMRGTFQGAGQNCIGIERFIVNVKIYDQFIDKVTPLIRKLRLGIDVGAMVSDRNLDFLEKVIQEAVSQGARLLVGGRRTSKGEKDVGHWFLPTLIVDVTQDMRIAQEELFAPVMVVMKATDNAQAISIANSTRYALGASVFGRNKSDCLHVSSHLKSGMVSINDFGSFYLAQSLPFGGRNSSGFGRFGGEEGLKALCNPKAVIVDRVFGWVQTGIPGTLRYPLKRGAWEFVKGLMRLAYGTSLAERGRGLLALLAPDNNAI